MSTSSSSLTISSGVRIIRRRQRLADPRAVLGALVAAAAGSAEAVEGLGRLLDVKDPLVLDLEPVLVVFHPLGMSKLTGPVSIPLRKPEVGELLGGVRQRTPDRA
jgi:hypothetical protein